MVEDPHKLIDEAAVVSFDIFDTLILRGVLRPVDLFAQVALEGGEAPDSFTALRVDAEQEARRRAWDREKRVEVTLQEIYDALGELNGWEPSRTSHLLQLEEQAEGRYCRRNPYVYSLYRYALDQGKQVILVSDIYLDEGWVRTILTGLGYEEYAHLFVSSAHGETKSNGGLYRIVLESLNIPAHEILHIGDNMDSDVRMAEKAGLRAWAYTKCSDQLEKAPALKRRLAAGKTEKNLTGSEALVESIWKGLVINRLLCRRHEAGPAKDDLDVGSFWEELGYVHVGILYLGLVTWLRSRLMEDGTDRVYFLSRDGYIMKEVYDRLLACGAKGPPAHYLYASRRAFNLAAIRKLDEAHTDFLVSGTSRLSVAQFLGRISIDSAEYIRQIQEVGLPGPNYVIDSGEDYGRLRALFRALAPSIEARATDERSLLHAYLEQMGLLAGGEAAIVDIGWHGSLQNSLNLLLRDSSSDTKLTGHYLATFPPAASFVESGDRHRGYLAESGEPKSTYDAIFASVEVFEWVFSADHGSVIRFAEGPEGVRPILEQSEVDEGKILLARHMQRGALDFIDDFLEQWRPPEQIEISPQMAARPLFNLLRSPSSREARSLGDLPHAEGFGDVYVQRSIARPSETLLNPFRYHRLLREYRTAFWRRGYRKRLLGF